ncbi:hypothetical protein COHA_005653 [Chlorella ohadii]|uniref:Uncharacterized protein n=1 Tax=Chlorella ohadii TaxID=2649997 RepID=A0AAD5DQX1_9CHLO|nr:hypothetical protein COHA_005653 [Chlorella ohadii]
MRQLVDLLNSIAGSAASRQSSLPAAGSSRGGTCRRASSSPMLTTAGAAAAPPPLSAELAARHPALRAAEAALEAKLENGAADCDEDYIRLAELNEQLGSQRGFDAAEARRDLNRYCDVLPYDDNRVRLGRPAFPPGWVSGSAAAASAAPAVNGSGTSPARGSGCGSSSSSGRGSGSAAEAGLGDLEDYVNASPLYSCDDGSGGCFGDERWAYIASQGPLKHTRDAFWRMAAEQGCGAVVMLTNTIERGMTKCAPYFAVAPYTYLRCGTPLSISFRPAHPHPAVERGMTKCAPYFAEAPRTAKSLGRFTVQTAEVEELLPDLHRRTLVLKDTQQPAVQPLAPQQGQQGQQAQQAGRMRLTHYHYSAWPDHGVPSSPQPLLRLCEELRAAGHHAGPVLVHCSAGIGRSGVFCVLDIVTRRLLGLLGAHDAAAGAAAVDLAALVAHLRRQRLGMVQTRDQYLFCHTALLAFVRQLAQQPQHATAQQAQHGAAQAQP